MAQARKYGLYAAGAVASLAIIAIVVQTGCSGDRNVVAPESFKRDLTESTTAAKEADTTLAQIEAQLKERASESEKNDDKKGAKKEVSKKSAAHAVVEKDVKRSVASNGSLYVVQLGAFREKQNAEAFHQKLKDGGYPVLLKTLQHSKNGQLHVVRIEPTTNKAEAQAMLANIKAKENLDGHIVILSENH